MTDEAPVWTILIPTLGERERLFRRLTGALMPQVDAARGRVEVIAYWNNGSPSLPEIRQALLLAARGDYVSFIDDDDMVPHYFVEETLRALDKKPDYVGWQTHYFANGEDRGLIDHSLRHGGWREEKKPVYRLLRDISHINPMRRDVALLGDFRKARGGQSEDRPWVDQIRRTGLLRDEVYIDRPMYRYLWERRGSRWQKPHRIQRHGNLRVEIDSPHFSYFGDVQERGLKLSAPDGARLGVVIPTRGRPHNIEKVIEAWDETGAWADADMILAIDNDDPAAPGYWLIQAGRPGVKIAEIPSWTPMVPKLNRVALATAKGADYFALGFAGDDHLPRTKGWARMYLDALGRLGSGMVYGDDGYQGAKLSTEWAVTADVVRALGRMVPAGVEHLYCDNAMMDLFSGAGALAHVPSVCIEHMHPVAGKAENDAQYRKVNSTAQFGRDGATYRTWRRHELPGQVNTIRQLRGAPVPPARQSRRSKGMPVQRSRPARRRSTVGPKQFANVRGATPDEIGMTLADFAGGIPADQAIVELGVFQARTALLMAWGARQGNGAHVYAIDPWDLPGNDYGPPFATSDSRAWAKYNVQTAGYAGRITLIQDFAHQAATFWSGAVNLGTGERAEPRPPVGLLFVDDDHSKEGARRSIEAWIPHLAEGAIIAIDDYGHPDWPGVAEAVDELVDEGVLKPITIYHERLAVTALVAPATTGAGGKDGTGAPEPPSAVTAITSEGVARRDLVSEGELGSVPVGTPIADLNLGQLRTLARGRGVKSSARLQRAELMSELGLPA